MTDSRRQAARSFAEELRDVLGERLDRVLLFGSVARGEPGEESDVDLVVVEGEQPIPQLSRLIGRWMVEHGTVLQVHVLSREEFEEMQGRGTAFANTLQREGEALA